jgi:hypothetical protein
MKTPLGSHCNGQKTEEEEEEFGEDSERIPDSQKRISLPR